MHKILLKVIAFTICIGVLALAFNTAFGNETVTYLVRQRYDFNDTHFYMYRFDFWPYIKNIQLSTSDLSILQFKMPTRHWHTIDSTTWWTDLTNNLALMVDYIIMVINILLYPIKIGAYLLRNMLAILGVNTDTTATYNGLAWVTSFINNILANFSIPYI